MSLTIIVNRSFVHLLVDVNPAGSEEKDIETQTPQRHAGQIENNNKGDMWKVKEKLSPSKNPVDHPVKPTTKTAPKHPVGEAAHHSSVDELSYEELEEKLRKLTPTEKKIPVTDKPTTTEEPTTFHHWREFVDNNPHFPQPTERPTEKETPIDKVTPTEKETSIDKVTPTKKEIPTEKETPIEKETPSEKKTPATKETSTAKEIPIKIKILSTKRTPTIVLTSVEDQHNGKWALKADLNVAYFLHCSSPLPFSPHKHSHTSTAKLTIK